MQLPSPLLRRPARLRDGVRRTRRVLLGLIFLNLGRGRGDGLRMKLDDSCDSLVYSAAQIVYVFSCYDGGRRVSVL